MAKITVEAIIAASPKKVWEAYVEPKHITKWNFASDDWQCPTAKNELKVGGKTKVTTTFDAEKMNPEKMQKDGWQAILNNFKKYVESH